MTPFHLPASVRLPISKWGAVSRLLLGAVITFLVAIQLTHTLGKPIDAWAILGAVILTLKDVQSFINQAWGQAFLTSPPAAGASVAGSPSETAGEKPE